MPISTFSHAQYPTAAGLNSIGTALNSAHNAMGDSALSAGCLKASSATFFFVHTHRYLHFSSTGALRDVRGVFPDVSLSESDSGVGVLDLDTISWLGYGTLYMVTGVSACLESAEP